MKKKKCVAKKRKGLFSMLAPGLTVLLLVFAVCFFLRIGKNKEYAEYGGDRMDSLRPDMEVNLLTVNEYSRPGIKTERINAIVVHYTANPGSSARNNRDYFENLSKTKDNKVSSNFVIGMEGEIVQCVPTWEVAYASNERNIDTVSIECCHPDDSGKFTEATYRSLVALCGWLCVKFELNSQDVIRHYDVTGKICPKYYVENEDEFFVLRQDIEKEIDRIKEEMDRVG